MAKAKTLSVPLDDEVARALAERAKRNGRSAEEEARAILEETLRTDRSRFWDTTDAIRGQFKYPMYVDSADQIREAREK